MPHTKTLKKLEKTQQNLMLCGGVLTIGLLYLCSENMSLKKKVNEKFQEVADITSTNSKSISELVDDVNTIIDSLP